MKRTVTLELGDRKYKFATADPQQDVDETFGTIKAEFDSYSDFVERYGYDRVLLMILLNSVKENVVLKRKISELTDKLEKQGKKGGD